MMPVQNAKDIEARLESIRNNRDLSCFDIVSIDDLSKADIDLILELATEFKKAKTQKLGLLRGVTIVNAFYENSTRTRTSFEMAGKHLGADTINISGSASSTKKGESLIDTTETLAAYHTQVIIVRSEFSGVPEQLRKVVPAAIINAGDGWHEHPSQALLDAMTMLESLNTLEGKIITIVGDIVHSRVFGSLVRIINTLGGKCRIACPSAFVPDSVEQAFEVSVFTNVEEALKDADVVYTLRVQEERGAKGYIPTLREYSKTFGITKKRLSLAKPNALLMHPGPVMRDIDMHAALVSIDEQSKILEQVENGMAVRAAMQWLVADRRDGRTKDWKAV